MAETQSDKEKFLAEEKASKEASDRYNELIDSLILIATSNRLRGEKFALINEQRAKFLKFNSEFSSRHVRDVYEKINEEALNEAKALIDKLSSVKKSLSTGQTQELENLSEQLKISLNKRLDVLIEQAKELTVKEELVKIREKKLGLKNASDRIQLTPKKAKPNLVFTNTKGEVVNMEAVMRLTVGDNLWSVVTSSQRSEWLRLGFRYVLHISVMDNKTTVICRLLNRTRRDLTIDQLPPMHIWCRSKVKLLKDGWDVKVFLKNFGK